MLYYAWNTDWSAVGQLRPVCSRSTSALRNYDWQLAAHVCVNALYSAIRISILLDHITKGLLRKAWLFSDTYKSTDAGSQICSHVDIVLVNGQGPLT